MVFGIIAFSMVALFYGVYYNFIDGSCDAVHRAWPKHVSRDTKIYVLPDKNTTIHEPKYICPDPNNKKYFLLVVIHSATKNFDLRNAIRETWGSYESYKMTSKVVEEYQRINGEDTDMFYNETNTNELDFKLIFVLGLPNAKDNPKTTQTLIDQEAEAYGDILQQHFVDSYHNLSMKAVMMLKWVTNKCNETVTYIMKSDDDVYVNLPLVVQYLRKTSLDFDLKVQKGNNGKNFVMIGRLVCTAKPSSKVNNKWYTPRYMYNGRRYPCFASGWGYILSMPAAEAIYRAALKIPLLHIEDVFITGLCREAAEEPITFIASTSQLSFDVDCRWLSVCIVLDVTFCHDVHGNNMRHFDKTLMDFNSIQRCAEEKKAKTAIERQFLQYEPKDGVQPNPFNYKPDYKKFRSLK